MSIKEQDFFDIPSENMYVPRIQPNKTNPDYGYGKREDKTNKGKGYFGEMPMKQKEGGVFGEVSSESDIKGKSPFATVEEEGKTSIPLDKNEQDFFDIPSTDTWVKPEDTLSFREHVKSGTKQAEREAIAGAWSAPSSTAEMWRFAASKLQKLGEEQAAKEGRELTESDKAFTQNVVNYIPDLIKSLGEKYPNIFPTYPEAKKKVGERLEKVTGEKIPEQPRGFTEKALVGSAKALPVVLSPASLPVKAAATVTSALTEGLDLSEKNKLIGNLTIPTITSLIESIASRRYIPPAGEMEAIYDRGRQLGMSERELAPIMATEGQVTRYGPLSSGHRRTREAYQQTGQVLGNVIEDMQNRPIGRTRLSNTAQNTLLTQLGDIENDIRGRTHALAPRQEALADFIRTARNDIQANGATPRQLIGTWRSINQIGAGRTELRRLMDPIHEAINSVDHQLAQDLRTTNTLYGRYLNNLRDINPTQFNAFVDAGELQQILGAVFSGDPNTLSKSLLNLIGLKGLRRMSSSMLTNPQAQSLGRNFGRAVRSGSSASAHAVGIQLKNYLKKNLPEEYNEIPWKELGIED